MADPASWRVLPETEDCDIVKEGDKIHHWAVFRSADDWAVWGTFQTEAAAKAAIANAEGKTNG
jgi:hypothetical protein